MGAFALSPITHWEQEMKILGPCWEGEEQSSRSNDTVSCTCSVSFHRNHTATIRSQVENPTASHVENEYSQPPRNSQVSAYAGKHQRTHPEMKAGLEWRSCDCPETREATEEKGIKLPL